MSINSKLQPVSVNFSLKEHTYEMLRDAILDMNIYGTDVDLRLDERQLAERLGISRTPIREALAKLEQEGFVDIQPRKGVFIKRKSLEDVLEMVVAWAALESMAARLATENASDDEIKGLRKLAMRHSASAAGADIEEYSEANIEFHQTILTMSKCALLKNMADGLFIHMHAIRRRAMREDNRAGKSVIDHMEIIEAIEARDADLADRLVREHTMRLHDHIRRTWIKVALKARGRKAVG